MMLVLHTSARRSSFCATRSYKYLTQLGLLSRPLSSSAPQEGIATISPKAKKKKRNDNSILIYHRNSNYNGTLQGATAFCALNTTYWVWYAQQCASSVLFGSAVPFFVHSEACLYGVTMACLMNYGGYKYASHLVSKIQYQPSSKEQQQVQVYGHTFWYPSKEPYQFKHGDIGLDPSKKEVQWLLEKLGGDAKQFRGYLPLKIHSTYNVRFPLLVYCNDSLEVKDSDAFLDALLVDMEEDEDNEDGFYDEDEQETAKGNPTSFQNAPVKTKKRRRKGIRRKR